MFTAAAIELNVTYRQTNNQTTREYLTTELGLIVDCLYKQMSWPSHNLISLPAAGHLDSTMLLNISVRSLSCVAAEKLRANWVGRKQLLSLPFILSVVVINFFLGFLYLFVSLLTLFIVSLTVCLWLFFRCIFPLSPLFFINFFIFYLFALFDLLFLSFYVLVWCSYYVFSFLRCMLTIVRLSVFGQQRPKESWWAGLSVGEVSRWGVGV